MNRVCNAQFVTYFMELWCILQTGLKRSNLFHTKCYIIAWMFYKIVWKTFMYGEILHRVLIIWTILCFVICKLDSLQLFITLRASMYSEEQSVSKSCNFVNSERRPFKRWNAVVLIYMYCTICWQLYSII